MKDDYSTLTDLAKKQIAAESKENELTAEIAKLKKENEQAIEKIAYLDQEVSTLRPMKFALKNAERERDNLKAKLQKVLDFIESLKRTQKLQEFLKPKTRGFKH